MKLIASSIFVLLVPFAVRVAAAEPPTPTAKPAAVPAVAAVKFSDVEYRHRFADPAATQFEYTPAGQEDLNAWKDMLTLVYYRQATDGDKLAAVANSVLETYKQNGGHVVRTDSVPRTEAKPAEHLLVILFRRDTFFEASFARLQLRDGIGTASIYGHRTYGADAAKDMGAWLTKNGEATEKALMSWTGGPKIPAPPQDAAKPK